MLEQECVVTKLCYNSTLPSSPNSHTTGSIHAPIHLSVYHLMLQSPQSMVKAFRPLVTKQMGSRLSNVHLLVG